MTTIKNDKNIIKCVIVDDEPIGREVIENFVKQIDFLQVIAVCEDAFDAFNILQKNQIDLLITDIEMPKFNGLELVNSLSYQPAIIFVTAHDKFAVNSFDLGVVDYLLKPVSFDRLLKAINRVKLLLSTKREESLIENKNLADYIFIKEDKGLKKILFKDILYIKSAKDYLRIYTTNNSNNDAKFFVTYLSMKGIQEKLPPHRFIRIHNSYLVPINAIKEVVKNSVILNTGESLPISQSHKESLLAALNQ